MPDVAGVVALVAAVRPLEAFFSTSQITAFANTLPAMLILFAVHSYTFSSTYEQKMSMVYPLFSGFACCWSHFKMSMVYFSFFAEKITGWPTRTGTINIKATQKAFRCHIFTAITALHNRCRVYRFVKTLLTPWIPIYSTCNFFYCPAFDAFRFHFYRLSICVFHRSKNRLVADNLIYRRQDGGNMVNCPLLLHNIRNLYNALPVQNQR